MKSSTRIYVVEFRREYLGRVKNVKFRATNCNEAVNAALSKAQQMSGDSSWEEWKPVRIWVQATGEEVTLGPR